MSYYGSNAIGAMLKKISSFSARKLFLPTLLVAVCFISTAEFATTNAQVMRPREIPIQQPPREGELPPVPVISYNVLDLSEEGISRNALNSIRLEIIASDAASLPGRFQKVWVAWKGHSFKYPTNIFGDENPPPDSSLDAFRPPVDVDRRIGSREVSTFGGVDDGLAWIPARMERISSPTVFGIKTKAIYLIKGLRSASDYCVALTVPRQHPWHRLGVEV